MSSAAELLDEAKKALESNSATTQKWGENVRKRAKDLSTQLDTGYMEMGRLLYQIWDSPSKGDQKLPPLYTEWGYKTFEEYSLKELGMDKRKAERLRRIAFTLEVELSGLDPEVRERVVKLGWTKVRELITLPLTIRNAAGWAANAEKLNVEELRLFIQAHKIERAQLEAMKAKSPPEKAPSDVPGDFPVTPPSPGGNDSPAMYGRSLAPKPTAPEDEPAVPDVPEKSKWKHFMLFEDQYSIVDAALDRASQVANSKKPGHLLTSICLDYLATNDFMQGGPEQFMRYMVKLEELLGVKLVAVDAEDHDVLYGISTLESLANAKE